MRDFYTNYFAQEDLPESVTGTKVVVDQARTNVGH
jgi:hypothetical protein